MREERLPLAGQLVLGGAAKPVFNWGTQRSSIAQHALSSDRLDLTVRPPCVIILCPSDTRIWILCADSLLFGSLKDRP